MALDPELLELMTQTVGVSVRTGFDGDGKAAFGAPTNHPARVVARSKRVLDWKGEERLSSHEVWVGAVTGIEVHDRLTLPGGATPPILRVDTYPDEDGNCFDKVWLG